MVCIWVLHLYQRKFHDAGAHKQEATLWLTFLVIGGWAAAWLFQPFSVGDEWLIVVAALAAGVLVWQRQLLLPFRRRCARCGKPLSVVSDVCL